MLSSRVKRNALLSAVSVIALAAASPEARAADAPVAMIGKAPAAVPARCGWWGEGGANWTGGRDVFFANPAFDAGRTKLGWEAAAGFDCGVGFTAWHVSGQVRYGEARRSGAYDPRGTFLVPSGQALPGTPSVRIPLAVQGTGTFTHKEEHALADFAVGRDVGLGLGAAQVKLGLRIAEIQARTTGSGVFNVPATAIGSAALIPTPFAFTQNSRFVGGGPRAGVDGTVPLGGGWSFDYLGGIAVLFGPRSLDVSGSGAAANAGIANFGVSDVAAVYNVDAQVGLSYWFDPNVKLTGSYRFDGYWGAVKTFNAAGAVSNENRFFAGPMLRLTAYTGGLSGDDAPRPMYAKAPVYLKAPRGPAPDQWSFWLEGASFDTQGGTVHLADTTDAGRPRHGWQGAGGFDIRFGATPWHVSGDVRYGSASRSGTLARAGNVAVPSLPASSPPGVPVPFLTTANGTFTQREQHALADFAVGRDVGLGVGPAQIQLKAGLRIAEITSKTAGSASFTAPTAFIPTFPAHFTGAAVGAFSFEQQSRFAGAGPRVGLDATVPLGERFGLDFSGGAAVLYGARSLAVNITGSGAPFGFTNFGASDSAAILNLEGQAGLSVLVTESLKLTAGYRFDGYWKALKTFDAQGNISSENRFYSGPTLRVTAKF